MNKILKSSIIYIITIICLSLVISGCGNNTRNGTINISDNISTSSRYPGCDTDDIISPDGKQIWSACNVGATKASQYKSCDDKKDQCPEEIAGKNFIWGDNRPYESGSTIISSTGADVWGGISVDPELIRGPCEKGYHIPSPKDIKDLLSIHIPETYDPNSPWKPKYHDFSIDFRNYFKIPSNAGILCNINYTGICGQTMNISSHQYFWTRELGYTDPHNPIEIDIESQKNNIFVGIINYSYLLDGSYYTPTREYHTHTSKHAIPVRCIKDGSENENTDLQIDNSNKTETNNESSNNNNY